MKRLAKGLSRRALVRNAGLAAGAGILGLGQEKGLYSQPQAAAGATGQPRVLALIGDRHHNPDYIRVSLDRVFKEVNVLRRPTPSNTTRSRRRCFGATTSFSFCARA